MGKRFLSLEDAEFNQLFFDFRYTCYRLETLQRYDVSYEREDYGRFLAGEAQGEPSGLRSWTDGTVGKAVAAGKRMQRVHVVEEPLSDYLRYEFGWAYEHNVSAGEDVRLIPIESGQWPEGIPHYDYWLFDSSILVAMYYSDSGAFTGAEIIDDPEQVVRANYWRDMALALSVPFRGYAPARQRR
jgi:hypothetical protein